MLAKILGYNFFGNSIFDYLMSMSIFIVSFIAIVIIKHITLKHLAIWAQKTATTIDDFVVEVLKQVVVPFAYFGAFYFSVKILFLNSVVDKFIVMVGSAVFTIFIACVISKFVQYGFECYWARGSKSYALEHSLKGIRKIVKTIIWGLAVVFFLDNLGFKISTVIAGLGIGGVAIALAAQAVLKDLFSYLSIIFDRPFEVGDFVIVGEYLGVIEHIGIKSTRIRSLSGEQVIFSNTDLTDSRVRNYKRMDKRRVLFKLGVTYQTTLAQVKEIPKVIENIIKNVPDTIFDRAHFFSYADFSLVFEVVYYVLTSDYNKYMDIQQEINFAIKEEFEKRNIEFAYPTQTLYVNKS